jgi:hypothetical protein
MPDRSLEIRLWVRAANLTLRHLRLSKSEGGEEVVVSILGTGFPEESRCVVLDIPRMRKGVRVLGAE